MMFPPLVLSRLIQRFNEDMSCNTPCSNCDCPETVYNSDYQELDSSPMGTEQARYFDELEAAASSSPMATFTLARYFDELEAAASSVIAELLAE